MKCLEEKCVEKIVFVSLVSDDKLLGNKTLSKSFESEIANPKMLKGHKSVMADEKKTAIESKMCDYDINKCQNG